MAAAPSAKREQTGADVHAIDLGGSVAHVFQFNASPDVTYDYFCDVPGVFGLLPDSLECYSYAPDRYRLLVGASDGHGHAMCAVFDLMAEGVPGQVIRVMPAYDGPPPPTTGMVFSGMLSAEAVFSPMKHGTAVEYNLDLSMSIPIPGVLRVLPLNFLRNLGEKGMEYKMNHMVDGFTDNISRDFDRWLRQG
jgi:hypothetical protein